MMQPAEAREDAVDKARWWLETKWLRHRNDVRGVHPLLLRLHESRGDAFMTIENVLAVMDAKNPEALVESWVGTRRESRRPCAWTPRCTFEGCSERASAVNAKFCETHAQSSKRLSKREYKRRLRGEKVPSRTP